MGRRNIGSVGLASSGVPDDLLTTKGDTHGYSSTNARIPIGANDTVLTADSSEALGLKWASAGGGGAVEFVGEFVQTGTTDQSFSTGAITSIDLTAYDVLGTITCDSVTTGARIDLKVNGTTDFKFVSCFINDAGSFSALYDTNSVGCPVTGNLDVEAGEHFTMQFCLMDAGNTVRSPLYYQAWGFNNPVNIFGVGWSESTMNTFTEMEVLHTDGSDGVNYIQNCTITLWKRAKS